MSRTTAWWAALLGGIAALLMSPDDVHAQTPELTGTAEVDHLSYLEGAPAGQMGRKQQGLLRLRATAGLSDWMEISAEGQLRGNRADGSEGRAYLNEAYADVLLPGLDLRIGKQTIVWGKTDVVNPTDHLAPRDFTDPLETDDERLGLLAVRARGALGPLRLEGIVAPSAAASRLPTLSSRWSPWLPPTIPNPSAPEQSLRATYALSGVAQPPLRAENTQLAARMSGTVHGWDLSLSWFDGWDDLPVTRSRVVPVSQEEVRVELTQSYSRRKAIGGDAATVVGPYTLRAEAAFLMPDSLGGPDYFQYVLGAERILGDPMAAGGTLLLLQWIHEVTPRGFQPEPFDLNHVFRAAVMARAQYNLTTDLQLAADGVYDLRAEGYYLQPGASYRLRDGLRLEAGVDLLGGSDEAFFGAFSGNRRFRTSLRYDF